MEGDAVLVQALLPLRTLAVPDARDRGRDALVVVVAVVVFTTALASTMALRDLAAPCLQIADRPARTVRVVEATAARLLRTEAVGVDAGRGLRALPVVVATVVAGAIVAVRAAAVVGTSLSGMAVAIQSAVVGVEAVRVIVARLALGTVLLDNAGRDQGDEEQNHDHPELARHGTPP